jgi:hypothetical protein
VGDEVEFSVATHSKRLTGVDVKFLPTGSVILEETVHEVPKILHTTLVEFDFCNLFRHFLLAELLLHRGETLYTKQERILKIAISELDPC